MFTRPEDRDLALYFTNVHPAMISMLRTHVQRLEFIARGTTDAVLKDFCAHAIVETRAHIDILCDLGAIKPDVEPPADG